MSAGDAVSGRQFNGQWDKSGDQPVWVQDHDSAVRDALSDWKGSPLDMHAHLREVGQPLPPHANGTMRIDRVLAEALHHEVSNAPPTPRTLYRGASREPVGITGWSERRSVANGWARRYNGAVHVLPKGGGRGIRVSDYISSGADDQEKEWLVKDPQGYTTEPPTSRRKQ